MIIYFDMDGVLVDFVKQANKYGCFTKKSKVNWKKVIKLGTNFWETMEWLPGAFLLYSKINELSKVYNFDIKILSSVGFDSGIQGKKNWILKNTNINLDNIIIVKKSNQKCNYANPSSILIDDDIENINDFKKFFGKAILHKNAKATFQEVKNIFQVKKGITMKKWNYEFNPSEYANKKSNSITLDEIFSQMKEYPELRNKTEKLLKKNLKEKETWDRYYSKSKKRFCLIRHLLHIIIMKRYLPLKKMIEALPSNNEKPKFIVVCGRPGAGKTLFEGLVYNDITVSHKNINSNIPNCIVANSDRIKEFFPGYKCTNAPLLQRESTYLMNIILQNSKGFNIVYDCTISDYVNVKKWVSYFINQNYQIEIHYMFTPIQIAVKRALLRYINKGSFNGRFVPAEIILEKNNNNEENFMSVISKFNITRWSFWDNSENDTVPKLIKKSY